MSQYIVSARKYRPSTFASVVGQGALTATLKNAVASNRLAHAYLFCGSRGVGKTSCARIFAKTINCSNPTADGEACNECASCRAFNENNSLNIVELDAASHNGIDDIKSLIEQVQIPPTHGRYRVFIIDEVHMLSSAAFNAFLKTLEEPPSYVIFILATTEKHKIIPTILSRCQIYDFSRITIKDIVAHLSAVAKNEGIAAETTALNVIARQADGAMRDALSIFDQVAASSRSNITYAATIESLNVLDSTYYVRLVEAFEKGDIPAALLVFHQVRQKGFDAQFFLNGLGQYLRDLMLASNDTTIGLIDEPDDVRDSMAAQARRLSPEFLYAAVAICSDADLNYRQSANKQLLVEVTLIRIAQLLNPSPAKSGLGEGLKPIAKQTEPQQATPSQSNSSTTAESHAAAESTITPSANTAAQQKTPHNQSPQSTGSTRRTVDRGGHTMQMGNLSMHQTHESEKKKVVVSRGRPYTEQMLKQAWLDTAATFSAEPALANMMTTFVPAIAPDQTIVLEVDSKSKQDYISERLEQIVDKLRDALSNDSVIINFAVKEGDISPRFWNDRQVLDFLMSSAEFSDFYRQMELTLL